VLTTIRDTKWALLYLAIFGSGTVLGMALLTSVISLPFALAKEKHARIRERLVGLASIASIGLGIVLAYRFGIVDGLLFGDVRWTPE
jgi:high-affinity nickel-transport protein